MSLITDSETTRVWWLPGITTAAAAASVAALAAGVDITCMLVRSSTLPSFGDDKTTSDDLVCNAEEIKAIIGNTVNDAELWLVHDFDNTGKLATTDPTKTFTGLQNQGTFVIRSGPRIEVPAAIGQIVDAYPMSAGKFQKQRFRDGYLKGKVKAYNLGGAKENLTLVA